MTAKKNLPHTTAIIVAAGSGTRMGSKLNKQFILIENIPVLAHTLLAFQAAEAIDEIIIVTKPDEILTTNDIVRDFNITKVTNIVPGGSTRQQSVQCGLKHVNRSEITVIHDGARPFVSVKRINNAVVTAFTDGAAALGVPVKDTVKIVDSSGKVLQTPDRGSMRLVQTPQAFRTDLIKLAYIRADESGFSGTDDCSVAENAGVPVTIIDGEYTNIKITTVEDLPIAEALYNFLKG